MVEKRRRDQAGYEAKRRQILKAATVVFAERGYEGCRVGDIAREAGIAYGLIYHYFENKEDILNSVFQGAWTVTTKVIEGIAGGEGSLREKLSSIAGFLLEAWKLEPATVEVVMVEVLRSPKFREEGQLEAYQRVFALIEGILESHRSELREDAQPRVAAVLFCGSLEILLTGFVARDFLRAEGLEPETTRDALIETFLSGITRRT